MKKKTIGVTRLSSGKNFNSRIAPVKRFRLMIYFNVCLATDMQQSIGQEVDY